MPFAAEPLVIISPPGTQGLSDTELLTRFPFVQFKRQTWIAQSINAELKARNIKIRSAMEIDSLESISLMVAEGLGVSIVPLRSHGQSLKHKLVVTPFGSKPLKRIVGILQRSSNPRAEFIRLFHGILKSLNNEKTGLPA